ncbi:MAG: lipase family protein [Pseudomonadota bacterium]
MRAMILFMTCAMGAGACSSEGGTSGTDPGTDTIVVQDLAQDLAPDVAPPPTLDPVTCGQTPFQWLGADQVGEMLQWEESAMTNVTPEFLITTIEQMGYSKSLEGMEHTVRNFRMRYTTQDKGASVEATGMVGIPTDVESDGPLPVLLWLHPTTGSNDACAPSRDPLAGPGQTSILSSLGYIAVAPDYIGMLGFGEGSPEDTIHPYMVAQPTALASLDAVRATLAWLEADPDLPKGDPTRVILWGGSQGGHACFVTERYQPYYAPELNIIAVAAAIPGTDLLAMAEHGATYWSDTSRGLTAVLTAMHAWFGLGDLADALTDEAPNFIASSAPGIMAGECGASSLFSGIDSVAGVYSEAFLAAAQAGTLGDFEPWGCFLKESSVDRMSVPRVSDVPFLATFGELDDLAQTSVELEAMVRYCAQGYRIEYHNCAGLGHVETAAATLPYMARWTADRLSGKEWDPAVVCSDSEPIDCDTL